MLLNKFILALCWIVAMAWSIVDATSQGGHHGAVQDSSAHHQQVFPSDPREINAVVKSFVATTLSKLSEQPLNYNMQTPLGKLECSYTLIQGTV